MSKNCEAAPELQVEQQLELVKWAAVWSSESVARRSTHQLTASAPVATSGRLHRVNKSALLPVCLAPYLTAFGKQFLF